MKLTKEQRELFSLIGKKGGQVKSEAKKKAGAENLKKARAKLLTLKQEKEAEIK